jgi:hypothetical protein
MSAFEHFDDFLDPGPQRRLMLEALLLDAPRDRECFRRWLREARLDALGPEALRLVPALYAKFEPVLEPGPARDFLAAQHRRRLDRNHQLLEDGQRVVAAFAQEGIETLLFKGVAMALRYFGPATRPMGDVDVLVRPVDVKRAEAVLQRDGWRYLWPGDRKAADRHSHDYVNERRSGFDLHWFALHESIEPGIDAGLWERARPFDWEGVDTRVMAPCDLMLLAIANGVRRTYPLALHWLPDVARLAGEPGFDWEALWSEATRRGLRAAVFDGLCMASCLAPAQVPESRLHALVDGDAAFARGLLDAAAGEGRAFGLRPDAREAAAAGAGAPDSPRHARMLPAHGEPVERIFLHARHVPRVPELFDVGERPVTQARDAFVTLAPRGIAPRASAVLRNYGAQMEILDGVEALTLAPREARRIRVRVENTSDCCWPVRCGTDALFGATYHLLSGQGELLVRDLPRTYLFLARRGYVAFLEPGQSLVRDVVIHGPEAPGRYIAQLDLVHEHAAWFSDRGCAFPRLALAVSDVR